MPARYVAQGAMVQSASGSYVHIAEYETLEAALQAVASVARTCFTQVEAGELSAAEAKDALFSTATIAGFALTP